MCAAKLLTSYFLLKYYILYKEKTLMVHATNTVRVMENTLQVPETNHVVVRVPKEFAGVTELRIRKNPEVKAAQDLFRAIIMASTQR